MRTRILIGLGAHFWRSEAVFLGEVVDIKRAQNKEGRSRRIKLPQENSAELKLVVQRIKP